MNPRFKAFIKDRKLVFYTPEMVENYLIGIQGDVEVVIRKWCEKIQRSIEQNRYYWGVVIKILSEATGYTGDEIHEILKQLFLSKRVYFKTKKGVEVHKIPQSTTGLTTAKMEEYLSQIRQWASIELGVYIPLPNEVEY